jgi:hypothetical protein
LAKSGRSETVVKRKRARDPALAHHFKAHEVDQRNVCGQRGKEGGNARGMRGLVNPDGAEHRDELVYETTDSDLPKAPVCDGGGLDKNVAVRDSLLVLERSERPLRLLMKPIITVEERVKR